MDLILMIVAFGAIMYFLMIRPQQKRAKEHQALMNSLEPGARVLMTSGMFGTLRHVGERQFIIELAPGTEVTVLKGNVARVVTAEEEEFEFADEVASHEESEGYDGISAEGLEPSHFNDQPLDPAGEEFDPRPADADPDVEPGPDSDDTRKNDN